MVPTDAEKLYVQHLKKNSSSPLLRTVRSRSLKGDFCESMEKKFDRGKVERNMEKQKTILIVDDEKDIRLLLKEYLEMEGYGTVLAKDAAEAQTALDKQPDLILLDVAMPGRDGLQFLEQIRERVRVPVLFLTARETQADRIKGLKAGGDDYITKPFSMEELLARIEAHLRREERNKLSQRAIPEGELVIDFAGYRVLKNGVDTGLTKTEFQIVELLFTNRGQVFTKEKIYETVWGFDKEGDSAVITEHIRRIRGKLGMPEGKEYIETVWGMGYKWIG